MYNTPSRIPLREGGADGTTPRTTPLATLRVTPRGVATPRSAIPAAAVEAASPDEPFNYLEAPAKVDGSNVKVHILAEPNG